METVALGELLVRRRLAMGFTQPKLGRKVGRSASAICQYERGERRIGPSVIPDLADALKIDAELLARLVMGSAR